MSDRRLPTGTLTLLFTDLEGSTRLLHEFGDRYGELLAAHRGLIRHAVSAHAGVEVDTAGDAIFAVFESATSAVAAAVDAQRALATHSWPAGVSMRVRMALHTGEVSVVDDGYVGMALHVAARLCAAGHGGQVLVSQSTRVLAGDAHVETLGSHRLRDVPEAVEIFQLCDDGLSGDFPPLRTLTALPNNLPSATDRLIGRELDIVEVAETLRDHRLVTLVGPGGSGKTRLALEVAASLLPNFPDGVWLVQLAAATTPDQVEALTAQELHIGERGTEPLAATVQERLAERELLLVLDNCEQLVDSVAHFIEGLLIRCPRVRVLTTSRELLGIPGEQAISVAPLGVGDLQHPGEAVMLFIERASAGVPGFDAATGDLALIAEVCRRLDGLPLAIELAAARLRSMSVQQIADRLHDRFNLLTTGSRTGATRQRTLEAVVAWSYDLLDENERATFRRLAAFADSFTLDAAQAVAGWDTLEPSNVFDNLARLVDKSLVVPLRDRGEYRYQLLETLRQYGREQLALADEYDASVRHLHAWARVYTERLENDMRTPRQDASLSAAGRERENLRAVYEQARELGDLELALRIVSFAPTMLARERRAAIDELLEALDDVPASLRGHALTSHAQFSFGMGLSQDGIDAAQEAAALFEGLGDRRHLAWARYFEAFSAWGFSDDDAVRALVLELLEEFRQLDEPLGLAYMSWVASQLEPNTERADARAAEAETLFRAIGSPFGLAHNLEGRALIALRGNKTASAAQYLSEALDLLSNPDDQGCTAHVIEAVASLLSQRELRTDAALLLGAAEELRRVSGHAHRPWELRSRELAEQMLGNAQIDDARNEGRSLDFDATILHAARLLDHARAHA